MQMKINVWWKESCHSFWYAEAMKCFSMAKYLTQVIFIQGKLIIEFEMLPKFGIVLDD
jgi:hypothetical protein